MGVVGWPHNTIAGLVVYRCEVAGRWHHAAVEDCTRRHSVCVLVCVSKTAYALC